MRPLSLTLNAFGAYPGEHTVDFNELGKRGLFLITGPTGSGKTTILDAMVWALYGELPGTRDQKGEVRSHHVADTVETYVEFTFEAGGRIYRVRRNASWQRPKERGTGTTAAGVGAQLVELNANGTEPLQSKFDDVSKACKRLIGLSADEFQRVVLLPQGKFTEFLLANEAGRQGLLSNLFRGKLYHDATEKLGEQVAALGAEVGGIDTQIQHHRQNAIRELGTVIRLWKPTDADVNPAPVPEAPDDDWLNGCIARLSAIRPVKEQEVANLEAAATEAEKVAATAGAAAKRFDDAQQLRSTIAGLEGQRAEREADAAAAAASKRGRPVKTASDIRDEAKRKLAEARDHRNSVANEVTAGFTALQEPLPSPLTAVAVTATLQVLASDVTTKLSKIKEAEEASRRAANAGGAYDEAVEFEAACREAHQNAQNRRDEIVRNIQALDPLANRVAELKDKVAAAKQRVAQRTDLETARDELPGAEAAEQKAKDAAVEAGQRFVDTQAPRLAKNLKADEACPVCGSASHPAPAHAPDGKAFEFEHLKAAQAAHQTTVKRVAEIQTTISQLASALGPDAQRTVDEMRTDHTRLKEELGKAEKADGKRTALRRDLAVAEDELEDAAAALTAAANATAAARTTAELARAHANSLAAEVAGYDKPALEAKRQALSRLDGVGARLEKADNDVAAKTAAHQSAEEALESALKPSEFPDVAAAIAAFLEPADETNRAQRHRQWLEDLTAAITKLGVLVEQGIPDPRPDAEGLAEIAKGVRTAAKLAREDFVTAGNALAAAETAMKKVVTIGAASAAKREALETARTVFTTCNGKAGIKVTLERWVLSGELQRVATAANIHLAHMSSGRYRIGRKEGTSSLELEVLDAHTGKARSPASLSGGEQFQASLSLALGMADVISQGGTGGGQQFEALFVDEGFGSLDAQALDDAISALEKIQATGRMVGAITHVEAMKERLPVGILVEPNVDGRGSKLRMV